MVIVDQGFVPLESAVAFGGEGEGVVAGGEGVVDGEVLVLKNGVGGVTEGGPERGGGAGEELKLAGVGEGGGGDVEVGGVGLPENGSGAGDELEVTVGEEGEGGSGVGGDGGRRPDWYAAGVIDGDEEERRVLFVRDKAQGEDLLVGGPTGGVSGAEAGAKGDGGGATCHGGGQEQ